MPLSSLSAPRAVLGGRFAEAAIGGTLIALLYDWSVDVDTDLADATAHGDFWKLFSALDSGWKFSAKTYVIPTSAAHIINQLYTSAAVPAAITIAGYSGTVASGTKIFEGSCIPTHAFLQAPMELAQQGFEAQGNGAPTTGV